MMHKAPLLHCLSWRKKPLALAVTRFILRQLKRNRKKEGKRSGSPVMQSRLHSRTIAGGSDDGEDYKPKKQSKPPRRARRTADLTYPPQPKPNPKLTHSW